MKIKKFLFDLNSTIIDQNGDSFSIEEIFELWKSTVKNLEKNSLVLILCGNNLESLFFYINLLENKTPTILIDKDSPSLLVKNILANYKPNYIVLPEQKENDYKGYLKFSFFRKYSIIKIKDELQHEIHNKLALMLSTSGSIGSPKMVRLSLKNLFSNALSISKYLDLNSFDKALTILPMNYSFGLSIINSHLLIGGTIVLTSKSIIQREFWDLFKKQKITSISGVPYTFEILKKIKFQQFELPSLKYITQAGGKLNIDLVNFFGQYSKINNINFFVMYGQTEGTARLSYLSPDMVLQKSESIGKGIPGGKLKIIDDDGEEINERDKKGELVYEGPNVMLGYAQNFHDLKLGDELKSYLKTGDIAYMDDEKYFYVVGRKKRFVKILGNRINLDELEQLISIYFTKCVCIASDDFIKIFILNPEKEKELKIFIQKKLKINLNYFSITIIRKFPINKFGKIQYGKLSI